MPTLQERIVSSYDSLPPNYRRIADYVLSHVNEVAFMTGAQLASQVEVDPTTVVRFAQRLGYPGYAELLAEIRAVVRAELQRQLTTTSPGVREADEPHAASMTQREGVEQIVTQLRSGDVEGLTDTLLKIYELVKHIEEEMRLIRPLLEQSQLTGESREPPEPKTRFPLYGIFPPSDTTWKDFQAAKRSWLKDVTDN